jgi:hypothetical protein
LTNLDSFGAGCGFLDFNQDGRPDVVTVGTPGIRLFLGAEGGRFTDASAALGLLGYRGHWTGLAVADVDGDGWPDLLVTGFKRLLLLRNLQGKRVSEVTAQAGLDGANWGRWGASAGFADLDGDGDLDLVLTNYVRLGPNYRWTCEFAPGVVSGCPPREYDPEYSRVFRNDGGRFTNVTVEAGCNTTHGKTLVVAFCDYDGDGRVDFYLGNDGTPSDLLHNLGGFHFRNVGIETGAAFGATGQPTSAMGADWGDYDRDGRFDLVATAFSDEEYSLLHQEQGLFRVVSERVGLGLPTFKPLGFGAKFLDVDNDGWLDLHFANGHVYDNVHLIDPGSEYAQPMMLFRRRPDGTYEDIAGTAGPGFATPMVGRGSAVGDYDGDGREDLLVVDLEGRLQLYHNETRNANHWLRVELRSARGGNRLAYGARLELRQGAALLLRQVAPASSYLSSSDPRVHFGLGDSAAIDSLRVRWPSGKVQEVKALPGDRGYRWTEGEEIHAEAPPGAPAAGKGP